MPRGVFVTAHECTAPQREEEFNRWFTHTFVPDISKAKGFVRARRYRGAADGGFTPSSGVNPPQQYLTVYEFDSSDLKESVKDVARLSLKAYEAGRHIDCIRTFTKGEGPRGGDWIEIDPSEHQPLPKVDYSRVVPAAVRARLDGLVAS